MADDPENAPELEQALRDKGYTAFSVERTREIGIFKDDGATNGQVMGVFLIESAMIGLIGGLIGLGLSALAMIAGGMMLQKLIRWKRVPRLASGLIRCFTACT